MFLTNHYTIIILSHLSQLHLIRVAWGWRKDTLWTSSSQGWRMTRSLESPINLHVLLEEAGVPGWTCKLHITWEPSLPWGVSSPPCRHWPERLQWKQTLVMTRNTADESERWDWTENNLQSWGEQLDDNPLWVCHERPYLYLISC